MLCSEVCEELNKTGRFCEIDYGNEEVPAEAELKSFVYRLFFRKRQLCLLLRCVHCLSGKARVVTLPKGRRLTFRDAIWYSNHVLADQVRLQNQARRVAAKRVCSKRAKETEYQGVSKTRGETNRMLERALMKKLCAIPFHAISSEASKFRKALLSWNILHRWCCFRTRI